MVVFPNKDEQIYKNETQEKTVSEDFLLETATGDRENRTLGKLLLGTTSCSSCAVPPNSVRPAAALYTRLFTDALAFKRFERAV